MLSSITIQTEVNTLFVHIMKQTQQGDVYGHGYGTISSSPQHIP